jgi:hypothetical protein
MTTTILTSPVLLRQRKARRAPLPMEILIPRQGERCFIGSAEVPLGMSPGSIRGHNRRLLEALEGVRCKVGKTGSIQLDISSYEMAMQELREIGLSAYLSLGDDFVEKFDALERRAGELGLALTIRSDTFPLVWEMLYTGSSRGEVQTESFWGFRHRIARYQLGVNTPGEEEIDAGSDFLFCYDHSLSYWQQELRRIERLVSPYFRFRLLENVLPKPSGTVSTSYLSDHFVDVLAMLELGCVHLACHCLADPDQSSVLSSRLVLSGPSWQVCIHLEELKAARRDFGFSLQPLVFLNACKTMTNPELLVQGESFPGGFLRFGASGVIATACDMPSQFAAEFAAKFYENLCVNIGGRSPTLSEALLRARQFFIKQPNLNPLGLAYGLYARNELHIEWEPWAGDEEEEMILNENTQTVQEGTGNCQMD